MIKKVEEKKPVKIALFRSLINIAFGLVKWRVLSNRKELLIAKEYNLISMYINQKMQMFSLRFNANKDIMSIDASSVDAVIIAKEKVTIIGDFEKKGIIRP